MNDLKVILDITRELMDLPPRIRRELLHIVRDLKRDLDGDKPPKLRLRK